MSNIIKILLLLLFILIGIYFVFVKSNKIIDDDILEDEVDDEDENEVEEKEDELVDIIAKVEEINNPKQNVELKDSEIINYLNKTLYTDEYKAALYLLKNGNKAGAIKSFKNLWNFFVQ
jgi:hypothetical protein